MCTDTVNENAVIVNCGARSILVQVDPIQGWSYCFKAGEEYSAWKPIRSPAEAEFILAILEMDKSFPEDLLPVTNAMKRIIQENPYGRE